MTNRRSMWRTIISFLNTLLPERVLARRRGSVPREIEGVESRLMLTAPHPLDLGTVASGDGSTGFVLNGVARGDQSGYSARTTGDVNGDGFDDFVIGAHRADGLATAPGDIGGEAYVVFGRADGFPAETNLSSLDGTNGFRIPGTENRIGVMVGSSGDVNGDGFHDLYISSYRSTDPDNTSARGVGEAFVIFGRSTAFPAVFDSDSLDGSNGFTLIGPTQNFGQFGLGGFAGDINGDGFDDVVASKVNLNGEVFVVYGKSSGFSSQVRVADLDGTDGFRITAEIERGEEVRFGRFPSTAGDFNGDGFADIVFGDSQSAVNGNRSGQAYVLFGSPTPLPATFDRSTLDGTNGFALNGIDADDWAGERTQNVGDLNGDGFDDIGIGADRADTNSGEAYVVFGAAGGFPASMELSSLDGTNGFRITPIDAEDQLGISISTIGDLNGDGYDDLGVGAQWADPNGVFSGETYVIFGKPSGWTGAFDPATLDGDNGFRLNGIDAGDRSGIFVNTAGDVDGDGFSDLIIGANLADPNGNSASGETYVIHGDDFTNAVTHAGDDNDNSLTGDAAANVMIGGRGDDTLTGNGGADVLRGGQGDDVLGISDLTFQRIDGGRGHDTLSLDGSGMVVDLENIKNATLTGIETIDLSGSGDNSLTLSALNVVNISDTSNTLLVRRDGGDAVTIGDGWTQGADETIGTTVFEVFTAGAATLKLEDPQAVISTVNLSLSANAGTEAGSTEITVTLTGDRAVFTDQTVDVTVTGTGITGGDYVLTDGDTVRPGSQIRIAAGQSSGSITFTVVDDGLVEAIETATLAISNLTPSLNPGAVVSGDIAITSDDMVGFTIAETNDSTTVTEATGAGNTDAFSVVLTAQPVSNVVLNIANGDTTEVSLNQALLTFTPANWNIAKVVSVTGVDDAAVDADQTSQVTISVVDAASDNAFDPLPNQTVDVTTRDNDLAGFRVFPSEGNTRVSESGTTDAIDVVLTAQPVTEVVLAVSSSDTGEATVNVDTLTFTPANWNQSQSVTATGIDDALVDGNQQSNILFSVDENASDDAFDHLPDRQATVTTVDDDAQFVVTESAGATVVGEDRSTDTFEVVLIAQPNAEVVLTVTSSDTAEATVDKALLTFTTANWDVPQTVTVSGTDDVTVDGTQTTSVSVAVEAANSDPAYANVADETVSVTTNDDDVAGFTVEETGGTTAATEAGVTDTFTVMLDAQPETAVVLTISSDDEDELAVDLASLTFTPGNWDVPQTVTAIAIDDPTVDGIRAVTVRINIDQQQSHDAFDLLAEQSIEVVTGDNDIAAFSISANAIDVTEGNTGAVTVLLDAQPLSDVVFNIAAANTNEVFADQATLTFTPGNWNEPQVVNVTAVDDDVDDSDQPVDILFSVDTNVSDDAFGALLNQTVQVTSVDNDTRGVTLSAISGSTSEGGSEFSFTVALDSEPTADVAIGLVSSDSTEGITDTTALYFPATDWNLPQTVTVTGVDDHIDDGDTAFSIITTAAVGGDYDGLNAADVAVINADDDVAGITVSEISGNTTEAGGESSFTVTLNTEPTADVEIGLMSSNSEEGVVDRASVLFTPENWHQIQVVTVTGVDDSIDDGDVTFSIVTAEVTGGGYDGIDPVDIAVINVDNDVVGISVSEISGSTTESGGSQTFTIVLESEPTAVVTIGLLSSDGTEGAVDQSEVVFDPTNWNVAQTVTITGEEDAVDDGDIAFSIITAAADGGDYSGLDAADVAVTNRDDDTSGITISTDSGHTTETGGLFSFAVLLDSEPTSAVTVGVASSDETEGVANVGSLTFMPTNWNEPQIVTVAGVDDSVDDDDVTYSVVTLPAIGGGYDGVNAADVVLSNIDDDTAGITISSTGGQTTESGGAFIFTAVINSEPTADVTITLTSSDTTEGIVSGTPLTFTAANWNLPQAVSIVGVNDDVDDGDITYEIVTAPAIGGDYSGLDAPDVAVTNTDDDTVGISVSNIHGNTTEQGSSTIFTMLLDSEPTADVTVELVSTNPQEGVVSSSPLTFTPINWNQPQAVTVTGADDDVDDGNVAYSIIAAGVAGGDYAGLSVANVAVTNVDDDARGVTVSPIMGNTTEAQGTATFTVVLDSEPTAAVTIGISSSNAAEGIASLDTLTFTTTDWNQTQTVTVTGVDDAIDDGDTAYTIITAPATGGDYDSIDADDVAIVNINDDFADFAVSKTTATVSEDGTSVVDSFDFVLKTQPAHSVTLNVLPPVHTHVFVDRTAFTFTPANWQQPQTVHLNGVDDTFDGGDTSTTVSIAVDEGTSDPAYYGLDDKAVNVITSDDDPAGFTLDKTVAVVSEDGTSVTDSFTITLHTEPVVSVVIDLLMPANPDAVVEFRRVVFTPGNWTVPQTITVTGLDDALLDGDEQTTIVLSVDTHFSDAAFNHLPDQSVAVITTDDEVMRGDVDGDTQFDANDSFLVHLVQLSGTDEQIDLSKGGSGLTVAEIRDKIGQLNPDGDVDGDSDFDANDSFLIHLVQLSGTDSQVDQSKGGSSLTASEIRARVSALRADSVGSTGTAKRTAKLLPAVPSGDDYSALDIALFGVTPVERERFQQTCSEEPKSAFGSAESSTGFRSWIDAL